MNLSFEKIIYIPIILIIIFVFIFVFMNIFIDIKTFLRPKKGTYIVEGATNGITRSFDDNKFKKIILPDIDDYDLEIGIPVDQNLNATVQGNWGFNQDENGTGFSTGIYRDGYSADGCIFKGVSEKRYKYMFDRGPYVILYKIRKNKEGKHDVTIFINNKKHLFIKNEGISSGNIKYIGTNETTLNKLTDSTDEGRRKVDYLKFIPKQE